jgi:hypothetical protein
LVPGPDARVADVDAKETIGFGPRKNLYFDGVVVACGEQRPEGSGARELEICGRREGVGCGFHSGEFELNLVVGAGAKAGKSSATGRHDPNPEVLNLVVFRPDSGRIRVRFRVTA